MVSWYDLFIISMKYTEKYMYLIAFYFANNSVFAFVDMVYILY